jgi:Ca2+-binding EF-hand superfamily protein
MQISSTPTAYGGNEAQRLLNMLLQQQTAAAGQDLPGAAAQTTGPHGPPPPAPTASPNAAQFVSDTLASLLSAQEAPPTSADIAGKIIGVADTNADGALSLSEIEKALGADTTSGADALDKAFSSIDTNGDGQISAGELTTALDAKNGAQGAQHTHHGHHAHGAGASSTDLAAKLLGSTDTNGDGALSVSEIQTALGDSAASATDSLTSAIGKLDTNGDGQLSATELSAAFDAFRAAHHRGGDGSATGSSSQTVTA